MLLSLPKGKMDFALSLEVARVGKEREGGGQREGEKPVLTLCLDKVI